MPFGQLFTSLATVREAIGSPIKDSTGISKNLYNETPFTHFINWALNLTDSNSKENFRREINGLEATTNHYNSSTPNYPDINNVDSLSIMWYLASFGTLVMFFLLISFSEVCCKKPVPILPENEPEMLPPPYDLFAPPTYDSLYEKKKEKNKKKRKKGNCEVFVINVFGDKKKSSESAQTAQTAESRRDLR